MNTVMALVNDPNNFLNSNITRIIFFLSATGCEATGMDSENDGVKEWTVGRVERTINKRGVGIIEKWF